jgi:hypothetical protein
MKKFLLGTTALATAGLIAGVACDATAADAANAQHGQSGQRIKVGIGGYHQQWGVYSNQNINTNDSNGGVDTKIKTNPVDQKHNSEICFIGESTLDNGITFGLNVQLEANTEADQIDESYLYIQGDSLGRIILGDENNAGYLLHVSAPDGGISIDSGDMINDLFWANTQATSYFNTALGTTNLRFNDNDSGKFTYISPRFAGFQIGASYIPQLEPGGGDNNSSVYKIRGSAVAVDGLNNFDTGRDGVAAGLNFSENFGGFGVQASVGWMGAETSGNDLSAGNAGLQVSYAGFSLGGAVNKAFSGSQAVAAGNNGSETAEFDSSSWIAGAAYEVGPYKVGISYMRGVADGFSNINKQARLDQANISGTYTLGPGIRLVGGFFAYDLDAQEPCKRTSVTCTGYNNNGWGFASGVKLGF